MVLTRHKSCSHAVKYTSRSKEENDNMPTDKTIQVTLGMKLIFSFCKNSNNKYSSVALYCVMTDHCSASFQVAREPIISCSLLVITQKNLNEHQKVFYLNRGKTSIHIIDNTHYRFCIFIRLSIKLLAKSQMCKIRRLLLPKLLLYSAGHVISTWWPPWATTQKKPFLNISNVIFISLVLKHLHTLWAVLIVILIWLSVEFQ